MRRASCLAPTGPAFNTGLDEPDLKPSLQEDL